MGNNTKKKNISRSEFIKSSSLILGGFAMLPHAGIFRKWGMADELIVDTDSSIVISSKVDPTEKVAAEKLREYILKMSGNTLPVVEENEFKGEKAIYVGHTDYAIGKNINFSQLKEDGYSFKRIGNNFVIAGGSGNGTLYGVYSLLENLGFRKYASGFTYIPKTKNISLPKNDKEVVPFIKYRTTNYFDGHDREYSDWHKLSSRDEWGLFVHTFQVLVPPEKYGKTHPEFFSLINGKRNPATQLCLSNEDVFKTVVAELGKRISENPKATYWSVSQNDNDQYCRCSNCAQLNEKYGGVPSGSITYFVNKVAKEFPDKIISTLAYWYTRKAPKNIKTEPNVNIMLCNIESTRENPVFETDLAFTKDLQDWGKISEDILIWDYNIQFASPVSPFPNLHTIGPNIKFYTDNNVRSLFMQATGNKGEFDHLRSYLICKLMWNPDADSDAIIREFLNGYYGAAGSFIGQYINSMRESLLKNNFRLNIFGYPRNAKESYLSLEMMNEYQQLFDKAEEAVKSDNQLLKRVQEARLPLMFAEIEIGQSEVDTPRSFYEHSPDGRVFAKPEMKKLVSLFVDGAKESGITRVRERAISIDDYMENFKRIYAKMDEMDEAISYGKKIISVTSPAKGKENVKRLTDGIFASFETWRNPDENWVGYEGVHMDFVLDLGKIMPVKSISMDFLNAQAQADWNLLVLPKYVTYAISSDGKKYSKAAKIINHHNPNPAENPDIIKIPYQSFAANMNSRKARYIKVHAESLLQMPSWHIRAGKPAIIYSDEIVVK